MRPGLCLLPAVVIGIAVGLSHPSPAPAASTDGAVPALGHRPSILLILPDQMRGQDLGCTGNSEVRTPHLDRLASQGLLFRNTFANTPVCCPARANIGLVQLMRGQGNTFASGHPRVFLTQPRKHEGISSGLPQALHRRVLPRIEPGPNSRARSPRT
jgi:hypothetical protein